MITKLSNYLTDLFLYEKVIDKELRIVYQVGFDVMISTAIQSTLIIGLGVVFGNIVSALLFLFCFMTIRMYSGGYHAKTRLRCIMTMLLAYCFTVKTTSYVMSLPAPIAVGLMTAFTIFDFIVFLLYAPVKNKAKILKGNWKQIYRKKAFCVFFFWKLMAVVLIKSFPCMGIQLFMIELVTSSLVLACKPWKVKPDE